MQPNISTQSLITDDINEKVEALLEQMTLAEKIGQMTQVEKNSITPQEVRDFAIGSVLSGGGGNPEPNTPQSWAAMVRGFAEAALESRLGIPLIYGVDAVHGHSNVVDAVIFPHNIGLGAARDADLVERIAHITAKEMLATGCYWNFAPAVSVPQDIRWGRTYEGYSEDTGIVIEMSRAFISGLHQPQDNGKWVLPSIKHFVADGGTDWNSTRPASWTKLGNWQAATEFYKIDQGNATIDEATLFETHLRPYVEAIKDGALNIMVSLSSWQGVKMHHHKTLLTDTLKNDLGFEGFLVSDWQAIDQIYEDFYTCVVESINAGLDMVMVPFDFKNFIDTLTQAVESGDVSQERIDDAVRRILRVKYVLGLFEDSLGDDSLLSTVGCAEHRAVAREAVQKTCVLLKNEKQALPLSTTIDQLIVSGAADDIGAQCGGWSIEWQGQRGNITDGTTLLDGLREHISETTQLTFDKDANFADNVKASVGIVVLSEDPYAEGVGDNPNLRLSDADISRLEKTRQHCDTLIAILYSGRPLVITDQLPIMDAFVAAWLPGTEATGIADLLFGKHRFTAKLSFTWIKSINQLPLANLTDYSDEPLWKLGDGLS